MKKSISLALVTMLLMTACAVNEIKTPAQLLSSTKPDYPSLSLEQEEEGRVTVKAEIATDGTVSAVEIEQSSEFERLDQAALKVVKTEFKFKPALNKNDKPVKSYLTVPFVFKIEN